jgi:succinate-acetate transporter protein
MRVSLSLSALRKTKWYEYAVRFVFGGTITMLAGLIANRYGPTLGGLFLAFPAIFPASATLVEKHERERKQQAGIKHTKRGRQAAALDAYGAALGAIGLLCFALVVWQLMLRHNLFLVLVAGTTAWTIVSALLWRLRKSRWWP